jgi:hypothetical protein
LLLTATGVLTAKSSAWFAAAFFSDWSHEKIALDKINIIKNLSFYFIDALL